MNRRAFLALPFIAPIAAVIAKALPAPKPEHDCWHCRKPVYGTRGYAQDYRGGIRFLKDGNAGDHVLCPGCGSMSLFFPARHFYTMVK